MKKQFGRRPSGNAPAWKKNGGKPGFSKKNFSGKKRDEHSGDNDRTGGERKFGDKPFKKRSFGERDGKSFGKKSYGDKPFRKKFGERDERSSEKRSYGDKPFRKNYGDRDERSSEKRAYGDKPFRKKFGEGGERSSEKRSYGDKPFRKKFGEGGERSSEKRAYGDKPFRKNYGDRDERSSEKRPYGDKPFRKNYGDRDERSSEKKPYGDKPFRKKSGERDERSSEKRSYGDKPFRKNSGDRNDDRSFRKGSGRDFRSRREEGSEQDGDWQVFDSTEDAQEFIKANRPEKKQGGASPKAAVFSENEGLIRLNRFIANTGICSRREADELIEAGVVKVNGKIVTELGTKVGPGDVVHYGDQLLRRERMVYVLLNKPKDYITTTDDPQERKTVMHLVAEAGKERIYPVGRLDRNTTGLLLLTNDGDLAERLTHPKYGIRKIYHVSLDKNLRAEDFEKISEGVELEDGFIKADEVSYVGEGTDKKEVGIVLHSGRNRIVRRLFEHLGYSVLQLDRVSYAGLTKKNLPRSKWRFLTAEEVGMLRMQVGGEKKKKKRF